MATKTRGEIRDEELRAASKRMSDAFEAFRMSSWKEGYEAGRQTRWTWRLWRWLGRLIGAWKPPASEVKR